MNNWKNNLTKNDELFKASVQELYYKNIALTEIIRRVMHKLQNEVPHADIAGYITAALATGMSAIEDGPRASAEAAALAEAEPLSQEDMAANEGDRLYDMENGK